MFLDYNIISNIVSVQIVTCFTTPLIDATDWYGVVNRNIIAPLFSRNQREYNGWWSGSFWMLADRS